MISLMEGRILEDVLWADERKILRVGDSLGVTLPPQFFKRGEIVRVIVYEDKVILLKKSNVKNIRK